MKKSLKTIPLSVAHLSDVQTAPIEFLHYAGEAGFSSVSIRLAPIVPNDPSFPIATPEAQAAVRRAVADTGVSLLFMEFLWMTDGPAPVDLWRRVLDAGSAVGARRLMVGGLSEDHSVVVDRISELCDLAAGYGVEVDFEPIPAAAIGTVKAGADILRRAGRPNAHLLLDALHFDRGKSRMEDVRAAKDLIKVFHLCDAPAGQSMTKEQLGVEASEHRLFPGDGALAIWPLIDILDDDCMIGVEVPMASLFPDLSVPQRLRKLHDASRAFLANQPRV